MGAGGISFGGVYLFSGAIGLVCLPFRHTAPSAGMPKAVISRQLASRPEPPIFTRMCNSSLLPSGDGAANLRRLDDDTPPCHRGRSNGIDLRRAIIQKILEI